MPSAAGPARLAPKEAQLAPVSDRAAAAAAIAGGKPAAGSIVAGSATAPKINPADLEPDPDPLAPIKAEDGNFVEAKTGVGVKGQGYGGGIITEPIRAKFRAEQMIVFDIQIPSGMKLYKAEHGKGPASHAEFMAKIIDAGQIKLPELPMGEEYIYDPATEKLMVRQNP